MMCLKNSSSTVHSHVLVIVIILLIVNTAVGFHTIIGEPPTFTQQPMDQVVFATDAQGNLMTLVLDCATTGDPQPTVTWFRNNRPVDARYVMDDGRLVIPNITEGEFASRSGVYYYCVATNTIGINSYTAAVRSRTANVSYAFFSGFSQDVTVNSNVNVAMGAADVALRCDVGESNPAPEIEWFNNVDPNADTPLVQNDDLRYLENGRYLAIVSLTAQQIDDQYRCHVTNAELFQRRVSPVIYSLNSTFPQNMLTTYKDIGTVSAFLGDDNVEFSFVGGSSTGVVSQCELVVDGGSNIDVTSSDGIGVITNAQIIMLPPPTAASNEYTISCEIGASGGNSVQTGVLQVFQRATITNAPENNREYVVGATENIEFTCEIAGVPTPSVVFYYNGIMCTVQVDSGVIVNGNTLTIASPTPNNSGIYQCSASNFGATVMETWILEIREQELPVIMPINVTEVGAINDRDFGAVILRDEGTLNVEFFVRVGGDPCPDVQWTLNDINITNGRDYTLSNPCLAGESSPYTFTITIHTLTEATSGNYSATFSALQSQATLPRLFITVPRPVIVRSLSLLIEGNLTLMPCLINNSMAILRCDVEGFPRPDIIFRRGTTLVEPGEPGFESYSMPFFNELRITHVSMEDHANGQYLCEVNGVTTLSAEQQATAEFPFCTFPVVVDSERTQQPRIGEDFFVQCTFDGIPRVTVEWMKDGQHLVPTSNIDIVVIQRPGSTQVMSMVNIEQAKDSCEETDAGVYTCTAENDAGSVSQSFRIQLEKPEVHTISVGVLVGAVIGAVLATIVIYTLILVLVLIFRRKGKSIDCTSQPIRSEAVHQNKIYDEIDQKTGRTAGYYDDVVLPAESTDHPVISICMDENVAYSASKKQTQPVTVFRSEHRNENNVEIDTSQDAEEVCL